MTASELATRLEAKLAGDGWITRCPAHDDHRASLSIGTGDDGRILVKCHAGCTIEAITTAANLTTADLFTRPKKTATKKKIVATYAYEDEHNQALYEAVRFEPKSFRQRRPDGKGGWLWNMKGVRRVVYHLPDIRVRLSDPECITHRREHNLVDDVFVVEGEKDVDRLWRQGFVATTSVGGAGKWCDDYAQQLVTAGASSVVVLPDNDDAGRTHAEDVARSCTAAGLTVKVVALPDLPAKGDVSDWVRHEADGQTIEKLIELVQAAPVYGTAIPTTEPADLAATLSNVETFIRRYVVLTPDAAALVALWVAQTYLMPAFDYVAYLHIKSPLPECGKTRLLETLESLVSKPWLTGRVTAAVLMRKTHSEHPSLLLDESDAAFNGGDPEYSEGLRSMLNSGFHRSGKASVCVGQGANLTYQDFSTFSPKAIAGIGKLPSTVESRSIPIALKRRTKDETIAKWRRRDAWAASESLRARLAGVAAVSGDALRQARPELPDGLSDRAEDVLEPLFAIADLAGADWPGRARQAAVNLMGFSARASQEADQSIALELLTDIQFVFAAKNNPTMMATKDIIAGLVAIDDRPWATFTKNDKPITAHRLSRLLKGFDVQPAGTLREGAETFKGYRVAAFLDAFDRYLPGDPGSKASHSNNPNKYGPETPKSEVSHGAAVTVLKTAVSPHKHCLCDDVTLSTPDPREQEDGDDSYYGA